MTPAMNPSQVLWAIAGILAVFFTAGLSMNIVLTALPVIVSDLDGNQIHYSWVVIINLLANAASTPIWGKLTDMVSKKRLFQCAAVIFIVACLLAGFAPTMEVLLAGRLLQGTAMGGVTTLTMAIIATVVPPRERGKYAGWLGLCMTTSTLGGPLLGGFIVDVSSWRWCFLTGVPLTVISGVLLTKVLQVVEEKRSVKVDYLGSVLLVASSSALLIWLSFAGVEEYFAWLSWQSGAILFGAVVLWCCGAVGAVCAGGARQQRAGGGAANDHQSDHVLSAGVLGVHCGVSWRASAVSDAVLPVGQRIGAYGGGADAGAHDFREPRGHYGDWPVGDPVRALEEVLGGGRGGSYCRAVGFGRCGRECAGVGDRRGAVRGGAGLRCADAEPDDCGAEHCAGHTRRPGKLSDCVLQDLRRRGLELSTGHGDGGAGGDAGSCHPDCGSGRPDVCQGRGGGIPGGGVYQRSRHYQ